MWDFCMWWPSCWVEAQVAGEAEWCSEQALSQNHHPSSSTETQQTDNICKWWSLCEMIDVNLTWNGSTLWAFKSWPWCCKPPLLRNKGLTTLYHLTVVITHIIICPRQTYLLPFSMAVVPLIFTLQLYGQQLKPKRKLVSVKFYLYSCLTLKKFYWSRI